MALFLIAIPIIARENFMEASLSGYSNLIHHFKRQLMKSQLHKSLLSGIRELHFKILQSNNLHEIGHYLQEILDKVVSVPQMPAKIAKTISRDLNKSGIIDMMKSDIRSILDGTLNRVEIARHQATCDIAKLKKLFTDPLPE